MSRLEFYIGVLAPKSPEEVHAFAAEMIEQTQSATADQMNALDQRHALGLALAAIAARLKPEEAEPFDGAIVDAIQVGRTLH